MRKYYGQKWLALAIAAAGVSAGMLAQGSAQETNKAKASETGTVKLSVPAPAPIPVPPAPAPKKEQAPKTAAETGAVKLSRPEEPTPAPKVEQAPKTASETGAVKLSRPEEPAEKPVPSPAKIKSEVSETGQVKLKLQLQKEEAGIAQKTPASPKETGEVVIRKMEEPAEISPEVTGQSILSAGRVSATPIENKKLVVVILEEDSAQEILGRLIEASGKEFYIITDSPQIGAELNAH